MKPNHYNLRPRHPPSSNNTNNSKNTKNTKNTKKRGREDENNTTIQHDNPSKINKSENKLSVLFEMGYKFEDMVNKEIENRFLTKKICNTREDCCNRELCKMTKKYMLEGIPIIQQAMLVNDNNKTFGVADLIVRSDYVNSICKNKVLSKEEEKMKAPNLSGNYHYVVIDIKWSSMNLTANEENLLNVERYTAYKGQLAIYNLALGILQAYIPNQAYILGKEWKCKSTMTNSYDCFNKLGVIDYDGFDEKYIELTGDAVKWVREVRNGGHEWSPFEPGREEMYTNMCVPNYKWDTVKKKIAQEIKDPTLFWNVGNKNRKYGHEQGIYRWDDENCTAESLNIKGKKIAPVLNKIFEINRSTDIRVYPKIITNNSYGWQNNEDLEFYIDFETVNECMVNNNIKLDYSKQNTNVIFLIGVGYRDSNYEFKYKYFKMEKFEIEEEKRILREFTNFIDDKVNMYKKKPIPKLFHWANAEETFLKTANVRHRNIFSEWLSRVQLVDLCKIFTT